MKYTRPEVEIMELEQVDVIQTSGEEPKEDIELDDNSTPGVGFKSNVPKI